MTRDVDPATIQSIRDRLKNIARENNEDFNYVVVRYGLERILYRLSRSSYRDQFVLKGATLFLYWQGEVHRPTRDADFTSPQEISTEEFELIVAELCEMEMDSEDGIIFLSETIESGRIRVGQAYEGIRVKLKARLGLQDFAVQLDLGFGDSLIPVPETIKYPTLLDFPSPRLKAYRKETTISEKFQNMVEMGIGNSRMKDFYDIWFLSENFEFEGPRLQEAITETFERRKTDVSGKTPLTLTDDFIDDDFTQTNWTAFLNGLDLTDADLSLEDVIDRIKAFLMPVSRAIQRDEIFNKHWEPGEGWV